MALHVQKIAPYAPGEHEMLVLPENRVERRVTINQWTPFSRQKELRFLSLRRLKVLAQCARPFPRHEKLFIDDAERSSWALYFCFLEEGAIEPRHEFTISRLKEEGCAVLVVCASPSVADADAFRALDVQGLLWKELRGYDFSGYTAGLWALAKAVGGANVLVLNDSILGPFHPLRALFESSPWRVTGLISSNFIERHVMSSCFYIKEFDEGFFQKSRNVFFRSICFHDQGPVALLQETRLARVMSRFAAVGSILSPSDEFKNNYYMLGNPKSLVDAGFPFVKRSIFHRFSSAFDQDFYRGFLEELAHPSV